MDSKSESCSGVLLSDCNDDNFGISPGREEVCRLSGPPVDEDGSGVADDKNADDDGWIDEAYPALAGVNSGDCDDASPTVNPHANEIDNQVGTSSVYLRIDDNCDGSVDEGFPTYDNDGDCWCENLGYCFDSTEPSCGNLRPGDCDDFGEDAAVRTPGRSEVADYIDNNCDDNEHRDEGLDTFDEDGDCFCELDVDSSEPCADGIDRSCASIERGNCLGDADPTIHPGVEDRPDAETIDRSCDNVGGDPSDALFVSTDGTGDSQACEFTTPCLTVAHAILRARQLGHSRVLLQQGVYEGPIARISSSTLVFAGGYFTGANQVPFGEREADSPDQTVITGASDSVLVVEDKSNITLHSLRIQPDDGLGSGDLATVEWLDSTLTLSNSEIVSPRARFGANGADGQHSPQSREPRGNNVNRSSTGSRSFAHTAGVGNLLCSTQISGTGGYAGYDSSSGERRGGYGGLKNIVNINICSIIVYRGRGSDWDLSGQDARGGRDGNSSHGAGGTSGSPRLFWTGTRFRGGDGALGQHGEPGGGGGGVGGGQSGFPVYSAKRGASGGAAGRAATVAGTGRTRGRSTIGILAVGSSTVIVSNTSQITGGTAGNRGPRWVGRHRSTRRIRRKRQRRQFGNLAQWERRSRWKRWKLRWWRWWRWWRWRQRVRHCSSTHSQSRRLRKSHHRRRPGWCRRTRRR